MTEDQPLDYSLDTGPNDFRRVFSWIKPKTDGRNCRLKYEKLMLPAELKHCFLWKIERLGRPLDSESGDMVLPINERFERWSWEYWILNLSTRRRQWRKVCAYFCHFLRGPNLFLSQSVICGSLGRSNHTLEKPSKSPLRFQKPFFSWIVTLSS